MPVVSALFAQIDSGKQKIVLCSTSGIVLYLIYTNLFVLKSWRCSWLHEPFVFPWKRCRNLTRGNKAICRSFAASHPPRRLRHKARDCCAKMPQQSLRALCGVFGCRQHKYGIIKPKAAHPVKEEENEQKGKARDAHPF